MLYHSVILLHVILELIKHFTKKKGELGFTVNKALDT